jgi:hypothetical protein
MRYQFNALGFDDRVVSGELMISVISSRPLRDVEELRGFESQTIRYVDRASREDLAECHRYVMTRGPRAGELGGGGRPDPKWLLVGDEEWNIAHSDDEEPCQDCTTWRPRVLGLH